jgi:hypothetical protein
MTILTLVVLIIRDDVRQVQLEKVLVMNEYPWWKNIYVRIPTVEVQLVCNEDLSIRAKSTQECIG